MSFTGDLEHLPIVDVIQLLHSTRKTGTLCLKSGRGESQLVFNDGYFVSANHLNNSVRIGQVLEEMNAVTHEELERALLEQREAGPDRKPLIATLIEQGTISRDVAYKGLETLIEMTIVEVLTWTSGTFSLDVTRVDVSDEYRYFPEILKQEIYMNAQSILMDALRIYDERMRDGTLAELFFAAGEDATDETPPGASGNPAITADILGLEALDTLEKRIPDVFTGIRDHDPAEEHRRVIEEELPDIPEAERDTLCAFLTSVSGEPTTGKGHAATEGPALAVIMFSRDRLLTHAVTTACRHEERFVFSTDEAVNLDPIIEQSLSRELLPVLVVDAPERGDDVSDAERIADLQQKREQYPQIAILQLVSPREYEFSLHALHAGVRTVLPRPDREERRESFAGDTIAFLTAFRSYLRISFIGTGQHVARQFRECIRELDTLSEAPELVFVLLRFASLLFERSITFVVGKTELIAEKGIGVKGDKGTGPSPPLKFRVPLGEPSLFRDVIASGRPFYGQADDEIVREHLFGAIGAPCSSRILLVPIRSFGRVIALIYGDFGSKAGFALQIDLLEILARHAELLLDNALYRKGFEKSA